jgi:hypothetical protein
MTPPISYLHKYPLRGRENYVFVVWGADSPPLFPSSAANPAESQKKTLLCSDLDDRLHSGQDFG